MHATHVSMSHSIISLFKHLTLNIFVNLSIFGVEYHWLALRGVRWSHWVGTTANDSLYMGDYCVAPLRDMAASMMTRYPTQSHYPDTELTSPRLILLMSSAWLESGKYQFYKPLVWFSQDSNSQHSAREACSRPIRPQRPVSREAAHEMHTYNKKENSSLQVFILTQCAM